MKKYMMMILLLLTALWAGSAAQAAIVVGRISYTEGMIYRYFDVDGSWVETSEQAPVGTEDLLSTGKDSRVEITFPNGLVVRMDGETEIEVLNLADNVGEFDLHSGLARFYNRSDAVELLVETTRGTLKVGPGSVADLLSYPEAVTVSAVHGKAFFYTNENGRERVEVVSGSTTLEFSLNSVVAGTGPLDRNWDRWCTDRQRLWSEYRSVRSEHLPDSMQEYAYVVEPHGRWQRVYYRGYYYWAWSPLDLTVGWSPFTTGYWYDWRGTNVWVDYNPWGWVTHHYGHWIDLHGSWMWTPYIHVSHVSGVNVIGLNISFGRSYRPYWHPGRVRWIGHKDHIGWLPLSPWETYYGYRNWGPGSVVLTGGARLSINLNLRNHRYIDHAVIIPRDKLHDRGHRRDRGFGKARLRNLNRNEISRHYKPLTFDREPSHRGLSAKFNRARDTEARTEGRRPGRVAADRKFPQRLNSAEKKERRNILGNRNIENNTKVNSSRESERRMLSKDSPGTRKVGTENIRQRNKSRDTVRALQQRRDKNFADREGTSARIGSPERNSRRNAAATAMSQILERNTKARRTAPPAGSLKRSAMENDNRAVTAGNPRLGSQRALRPAPKTTGQGIPRQAKNATNTGRNLKRDTPVRKSAADRTGNNNRTGRNRLGAWSNDREKQGAGYSSNDRKRGFLGSMGDNGRRADRNWNASSLNGRRIR